MVVSGSSPTFSTSYLLQVVDLGGEGLLQDPQDLPALLQREGGGGALRRRRSLAARLFHGCFHDTVTAWKQRAGQGQAGNTTNAGPEALPVRVFRISGLGL